MLDEPTTTSPAPSAPIAHNDRFARLAGIRFEAAEPSGDPGGYAPAAAPAADPAAGQPAPEAAPVEPDWFSIPGMPGAPGAQPQAAPPDPGFMTEDEMLRIAQQGTRTVLEDLLTAADAQEQHQPGGLPPYDPFNPDSVVAHAQAALAPQIDELRQMLGQFGEVRDQYLQERGEQNARQSLEQLKGEIGDFDTGRALHTAAYLASQGVDPHEALSQAARDHHEYAVGIATQAAQALLAHLRTLAGMPDTGSAAGGGQPAAAVPAPPGPAIKRGGEHGSDPYRAQLGASLTAMGHRPGLQVVPGGMG